MRFINRAVVVVKARQPMVDWINHHPDLDMRTTLEELHEDCTAILVPDKDDNEQIRAYVTRLKPTLFANELASWYRDESTWPDPLSARLFNQWFDLEVHSCVLDVVDRPIVHEEY